MSRISISTFRCDVTPPVGHPLCAGWYGPAVAVADPLYALGIVLCGADAPVVLGAIDWAEISNQSHVKWRTELAKAAGTTADRVAVQCTHAHCTPWPDEYAQSVVQQYRDVPAVMDVQWCDQAVKRVADTVRDALTRMQPVTHVGIGQAPVHRVASNRRVFGPDGRVQAVRLTQTKDPAVRAEPEGLIDPLLRTITFGNTDRDHAALHYYAVHPTSYDKDQTITREFVGIARERVGERTPGCLQIYFTGCAGNITAGKYNDGRTELREVLTRRIIDAMTESLASVDRYPVEGYRWDVEPVRLPPRGDLVDAELRALIGDPKRSPLQRNHMAIPLAYLQRLDTPIPVTCLTVGDRVKILNLPGEAFIEYQLEAQLLARRHVVAVAAYGDCGPGYICMERSFDEGGYEPTDSFVAPASEHLLRAAVHRLVAGRP